MQGAPLAFSIGTLVATQGCCFQHYTPTIDKTCNLLMMDQAFEREVRPRLGH